MNLVQSVDTQDEIRCCSQAGTIPIAGRRGRGQACPDDRDRDRSDEGCLGER